MDRFEKKYCSCCSAPSPLHGEAVCRCDPSIAFNYQAGDPTGILLYFVAKYSPFSTKPWLIIPDRGAGDIEKSFPWIGMVRYFGSVYKVEFHPNQYYRVHGPLFSFEDQGSYHKQIDICYRNPDIVRTLTTLLVRYQISTNAIGNQITNYPYKIWTKDNTEHLISTDWRNKEPCFCCGEVIRPRELWPACQCRPADRLSDINVALICILRGLYTPAEYNGGYVNFAGRITRLNTGCSDLRLENGTSFGYTFRAFFHYLQNFGTTRTPEDNQQGFSVSDSE